MGKLTIELKSFQTIFPQAMDGFEQEHQRFSTTQNQVGYIVEALHSRVKYSYSYFVHSKIDTRKGFRNRKNCETGSIGSAKADVAPLCICLTYALFCYVSLCVLCGSSKATLRCYTSICDGII